jgi:hypothetical protein
MMTVREREREGERERDRERRTCGERDDEQPGVLCQDPCSRDLCIAFRLKSRENGGVRTEQRRQLKDGPDRAREGDGVRDRSVAVLIVPTTTVRDEYARVSAQKGNRKRESTRTASVRLRKSVLPGESSSISGASAKTQ